MKKTVKKLALSKETVLGLTDLERAVGATETSETYSWCYGCGCQSYAYVCDAQETAHPTCIA